MTKAVQQASGEHVSIDLSRPDSSALVRGRNCFIEGLWLLVGAPLLASRFILSASFRSFLLRLFGAKIGVKMYMKPGVRVKFPWRLEVGDYCWIGEDVWLDNLAEIRIDSHVCVSQGAYLCTGNHDWSTHNLKLFTGGIHLERGCWVGAKTLVGPGVTVGEGAVLTAGSVTGKNLAPFGIYTGNPAVYTKHRTVKA